MKNMISKTIVVSLITLASVQSFAGQFTCTCKVQRSNGDTAQAVARVNADSDYEAEQVASEPCYAKAESKLSDFASSFTEYYPVYIRCDKGGLIDVE